MQQRHPNFLMYLGVGMFILMGLISIFEVQSCFKNIGNSLSKVLFPLQSHYVLTANDGVVGLVVQADKTCPYRSGVGAILTGQITADGVAGDANHHRYHGIMSGCSFDAIIADQDLHTLSFQAVENQAKIHDTIAQFPPAVMQDAMSITNNR